MAERKGQLTFFFIIGMILASVMILALFYASPKAIYKDLSGLIAAPEYVQDVRRHVDGCLQSSAKEGIFLVAQQGGYFSPSKESDVFNIPRYIYKNKKNVPSKKLIEDEISKFVSWRLGSCINDFKDFSGLNVTTGGRTVVYTALENNVVKIKLEYPLVIKKGEITSKTKDPYLEEIPSKVGVMYEISKSIVDEKIKNPGSTCLSCLYNLADKNDVIIDFMDTSQGTIFTIRDDSSTYLGGPLEFVFGIE